MTMTIIGLVIMCVLIGIYSRLGTIRNDTKETSEAAEETYTVLWTIRDALLRMEETEPQPLNHATASDTAASDTAASDTADTRIADIQVPEFMKQRSG